MEQLNYVGGSMLRKLLRKLSKYINELYRKEHLRITGMILSAQIAMSGIALVG